MKLLINNGFQINQDKPSMALKDKEFFLPYLEEEKILLNIHGKML